jgi:hypothetical protein
MEKELFDSYVKGFFKALKEKTLLIIIDSTSKGSTAVFSLVSFAKKNDAYCGYKDYAPMLKELGFKQRKNESLFSTGCAGRFSLYILDNIGIELKGHGVRLPKNYHNWIQYQNCI